MVKCLFTKDGVWVTKIRQIEQVAVEYFTDLFKTTSPSAQLMNQVTSSVEPKVTPEMNNGLLVDFSPKDIADALKQFHPDKSPGPDGMSPFFF